MILPKRTICHTSSLSLLFAAFVVASNGYKTSAAPRAKAKTPKIVAASTNMPLVPVTDPVEKSFTVRMPKGWRNQAYLARSYELFRVVVTSLSPDGKTLLFSGDPRMPLYKYPVAGMGEYESILEMNPLMKIGNYVPPKIYFPRYAREKFGKLPNFRITSVTPHPELVRDIRRKLEPRGVPFNTDAVRVRFSYTDNGKPMSALLNGSAVAIETLWYPEVNGLTTSGDPLRYDALLKKVISTHQTSKQWMAKEQALHEQRMAQLRQDHQNQIASYNASNQRHEMRMKAIQDAGDANMQKWYQNQAKSDVTQRNFLNYITEEHTVVDNSGKTYQVDNSHQKYFVNRNDNTYIGTQSTTSLNDLYRMGVNPNDYKEAKIKR